MRALRLLALSAAAGTLLAPAGGTRAQLLITGNDEKVWFDETGKTINQPPGKARPISTWRWSPIPSTGSETAKAGRACQITGSM